jgi:hypothetical protein
VEGSSPRESLRYEAAATPDEPRPLPVAPTIFYKKHRFKLEALSMNFWGCTSVPPDPTSAPIGLPRDAGPSPNRRSARCRGLRAMTGAHSVVARWFCRTQEALSMIGFSDFPALSAPFQEARP